jgi:hypothetical protein
MVAVTGATTNWIVDEQATYPGKIDAIDAAQQFTLGTILRAKHATFGEGEFIYLGGCASTLVGSLVSYLATAGTTALSTASVGSIPRPFAVAMSANNLTTTFGWYQIAGSATILKTAVKVDPAAATHPTNVYLSGTSGRIMQTSAAVRCVMGASFEALTTVTSTTSTAVVTINRPHGQGPII